MEIKELSPQNQKIMEQIEPELQTYVKWFLALTEIYHPSTVSEPISNAIIKWCKSMGSEVEFDKYFNIIARIPSNKKSDKATCIAIQAHSDMVLVGELNEQKVDVSYEVGDQRILVAHNSTLGADDGFGVALMLEMIERQKEFTHGPMEFIITSDEEIGLQGIKKMPRADSTEKSDLSRLNSKYMFNCDSLKGDKIYLGSAGAMIFRATLDIDIESIPSDNMILRYKVSGLLSGHSGNAINLGRGNAILYTAKYLKKLLENNVEYRIVSYSGGNAINSIPYFSELEIAISPENKGKALSLLESSICEMKEAHPVEVGANFEYSIDCDRCVTKETAITVKCSEIITKFLTTTRHGVIRMHPIYTDTVDTSQNLYQVILNKESKTFWIGSFGRSATPEMIEDNEKHFKQCLNDTGLKSSLELDQTSHAWSPDPNSKLAVIFADAFEKETGRRLPTGLIPVTIEPPEFLFLGYDIDIIAVCPSLPKAHCIGEWMDLDEANAFRRSIFRAVEAID